MNESLRVTTPPRERGGFLEHACLSPTTLRSTGFVQASQPEAGVLHPGWGIPRTAGGFTQSRPKAPIGLDTDQATEASDVEGFDLGYCLTARPSPSNRQQQAVKERPHATSDQRRIQLR